MSPLAPHLQAVHDAAATRDHTQRAADDVLIRAITGARENHYTLQEIADVIGVTRQAVQQMLARRD